MGRPANHERRKPFKGPRSDRGHPAAIRRPPSSITNKGRHSSEGHGSLVKSLQLIRLSEITFCPFIYICPMMEN